MKKLSLLLSLGLSWAAFGDTKKIVTTMEYTEEMLRELNSVSPDVKVVRVEKDKFISEVVDADAIFGTVSPEIMRVAKKLKWVSLFHADPET